MVWKIEGIRFPSQILEGYEKLTANITAKCIEEKIFGSLCMIEMHWNADGKTYHNSIHACVSIVKNQSKM